MITGICEGVNIFIWTSLPHGWLPVQGETVTFANKSYKVIDREYTQTDIILTLITL